MFQSTRSTQEDFIQYVKEMMHLQEVMNLLFWDTRTGAPQKGISQRSEVTGTLYTKKFAMSISPVMKTFLDELTQPDTYQRLSNITKKMVDLAQNEYDRNTKIPVAEYKEYVIVMTNAGKAWQVAKQKSDFSLFQPYLEKLVEYNKRFITYWGYSGNRYNQLLDLYDPGMTVELLDDVFKKLKQKLIPLLKRVTSAKEQPTTDFLFQHFPLEKQKEFHSYLLKEMGYDFDRGRIDETIHPFAITINRNDVRITTRYVERDFMSALFGTIHEFGHALYEQNISAELIGTSLCEGTSAGIHESQSLFWEKMIGRQKAFWRHYLLILKEFNQDQFTGVDLETFYHAINTVKPSLIRIEADELTYPLHVILRYELEKGLFNEEITVKELPDIWNQKMFEYLGVSPPDDAKGILQDMHWSAGMFGQFPSYALGYLYAAQFRSAMLKDLNESDFLAENANFCSIREWLSQNIHVHGKLKGPNEILLEVTGETLNPDHLIHYLEEKYSEIYNFNSNI